MSQSNRCIAHIEGALSSATVNHRSDTADLKVGAVIVIPGLGAYKIVRCKPTSVEVNNRPIFDVVVEPKRVSETPGEISHAAD